MTHPLAAQLRLVARGHTNREMAERLFLSIRTVESHRARIQRNQAAAQLRALELSIAAEVTNAALQVESNLKRYEAATAARELAETRLSVLDWR